MSRSSWLVIPYRREPARAQLICFPYAGGGAAAFSGWGRLLPDDLKLVSVQYPGRHHLMDEPAMCRMEALADGLAEQIAPLLAAPLPTLVYGHSMGSLVAFEVLRRLRDRGVRPPEHFWVGAFSAPHLPFPNAEFHLLDDDRFLTAVAATYDAIPPEILSDPEWRRLLMSSLRADFELLYYYRFRPAPSLSMPLRAFVGTQDRLSLGALQEWAQHTSGSFASEAIAGGHFFFRPDPMPLLNRMIAVLSGVGVPANCRV